MQILTSSPAADSHEAFVPLIQPLGSGEATVKLLFVKHHQNYCQAKSLVFGGANFHLLTMDTEAEVQKFLAAEEVGVILVDCRKEKDGGFDFVEKLRRAQPSVRVVLVADQFDLNSVVRGIRLGLKDVHTPPLDFGAVLANLIDFTGLNRERRSAFSAGITSHLVDFLQGREVRAVERAPEAAEDPAAGPAAGKKIALKSKFTSLAAEQAKIRSVSGQLASEMEALEVRKLELDRREAALKSRESTSAGRDTWPAQLPGAVGKEAAGRQDELKQAEAALARRREQADRQEAAMAERLAVLKNEEARMAAARIALEAEQTKAAVREQDRRRATAGPSKDQAAAAERQKLADERKALDVQTRQWEEEQATLRNSLAAERSARAAEVLALAGERQAGLERAHKFQEELKAARETLAAEQAAHAAFRLEQAAMPETPQPPDPTPVLAGGADAPPGVPAREHQQVVEERDRFRQEANDLEREVRSLSERLAAAPVDDGLAERRAALAQAEALMKAEVDRIASREASTNAAAARLAVEQAEFAKLVAERTQGFQARKAALREQEARLQAAAHAAAMAPARPQPPAGAKGETEAGEIAKAQAQLAAKLLELEKVEADMVVERQRFLKDGRLPAPAAGGAKASPSAPAAGSPVAAAPARPGLFRGRSRGLAKGPPLVPPAPAG